MIQHNEVETKEITKEEAMKRFKCRRRMRLYFVKNFFMAVVDLPTGKIFGCEEGSKVWWHERGHIEFNNSEFGARISYYQVFFMMIAILSLSLALVTNFFFFKIFALVNAIGMIVCYAYEEIWCWWWGLREHKKEIIKS